MKKAFRILLKILAGFVIFVFLVIYVVIPVGVPPLVRSQGSKILKHRVELRSVWFNPFLLRVSIGGLKILDADRQVVAGFDKFWVDASFLALLRKQYRVEIIGLNRLQVHAALLAGNKINLIELVPAVNQTAPATAPAAALQHETVSGQQPAPAQQLPAFSIDAIRMTNATVTFTDRTIEPAFMTSLSAMNLNVTGFSTDPDARTNVTFSSRLDQQGEISVQAAARLFAKPLEMETSFSLNRYALSVLTPYVGKYTGRAVKDGGQLDLNMEYRISDNKLDARHKLLIQKFDFGDKVESQSALPLPFGLVIALLEDPQGRITVSLPVYGDVSDPQFRYLPLLGKTAANFVMKLVTSPFTALLSMAGLEGASEELGRVTFDPGSALLTDATVEKLKVLIQALNNRPKISLEINGSCDPEADWKAIKTQAFDEEFIRRRLESTGDDLLILKQMYRLRFGIRAYWVLVRRFTSAKQIDADALRAEMKRLVIEEGEPDAAALDALSRQRAEAVRAYLSDGGCDMSRVAVGELKRVQQSMGQVPLEFTLTVWGSEEIDAVPSEG
jgi:outer membrane protein OmpA-like peptidoglycan-associated protein